MTQGCASSAQPTPHSPLAHTPPPFRRCRAPPSSPAAVAASVPSASTHSCPVVALSFNDAADRAAADRAADRAPAGVAAAAATAACGFTTVSADGLVCEWDGRAVAAPVRSFVLRKRAPQAGVGGGGGGGGGAQLGHTAPAAGVRPSAVACVPSAPHVWFVGEEDGSLAWGDVAALAPLPPPDGGSHGAPGLAATLTACGAGGAADESVGAHGAPPRHAGAVSAASAHPRFDHLQGGGGDDDELLLTGGFDGTVRLWAARGQRRLAQLATWDAAGAAGNLVSDVAWSPTHPCVFAAADTGGSLRLWHVGRDERAPVLVVRTAAAAAAAAAGLTRLQWAPDGRALALGDAAGQVHVVPVASEYAAAGAAGDGGGGGDDEGGALAALRARVREWTGLADA